MKCLSGPVHTYPNVFESATFSFQIQKFPCADVSVLISDLPFHTYPTRIPIHSTTQDSSGEYWQQSMRRSARGICTLLCLERTWERSWHLNYSIHGKELSSILLRHRITKYPDLASTRFRIHGVLKNFLSGERIQKRCGFVCRNHRIRVDGSRIRKKKMWRIQEYPDTCGRGFKWTLSQVAPLKEGNFKSTS